MRQLAEGGHISPRQQTPVAGTPSSSSSIVRMPGADQVTPVCLPLLSESNQILWVYSNQIELPPASVAELNKAFDRFPYLTDNQSTELAKRCFMHPDKVKVWFMAQRVLYGISWDVKDILDVGSKFRSRTKDAEDKREVLNEMDKEMQENQRKIQADKDKESEEEKKGEEKSPKEGTMMAQKVSTNENLDRKSKQKQPAKKVEPNEAENNTKIQNKRKQRSKIENRRKKRVKRDNDDEGNTEVEIQINKSENESEAFTESEGAVLNRKKRKAKKKQRKTFSKNPSETDVLLSSSSLLKPPIQTLNTVPLTENQTDPDPEHRADDPSNVSLMTPGNVSFEGKPEAVAGLEEDLHTETFDSDIMVTDVGKLKELTSVDNGLEPAEDPPAPIKQDADKTRSRNKYKTQTQLAKLKIAFLHCQYPDIEQYTWLAKEAGISRTDLVQWYGDMRYALKRAKPKWMTVEQYKQTLRKITYHQYLNKLKKSTEDLGNTALVKKLESKRSKEEEKEEASEVKAV